MTSNKSQMINFLYNINKTKIRGPKSVYSVNQYAIQIVLSQVDERPSTI